MPKEQMCGVTMQPHPIFANIPMPTAFDLDQFHCIWLRGVNCQEDFAAVMETAPTLSGLFGNTWPDGLTLAENEIDLHWHEREFTMQRSFAWIIRDRADAYLGCCYLMPSWRDLNVAKATYWIVKPEENAATLTAFEPLFEAWLKSLLPPTLRFNVSSNGPAANTGETERETA